MRAFNLLHSAQAGVVDDSGLRLSHDFSVMSQLPAQIAFSRTSQAWDYQLREYASGQPRLVSGEGLLIEEQRTNKCENFNVGQSGTEGMTQAGGVTRFERVALSGAPSDVLQPFRAKGFDESTVQGLFVLQTNENNGRVNIAGATGNTNVHDGSVYAHIRYGSGSLVDLIDGTLITSLASNFERSSGSWTPAGVNSALRVRSNTALSEIWFFANQMEEGDFATSPIVTNGAAQIRAAESASEPIVFSLTGPGTMTVSWRHVNGPQLPKNPVAVDLGQLAPTTDIVRIGWDNTERVQATYVLAGVTETNMRQPSPTMSTYAGEVLTGKFTFNTNDFAFDLDGNVLTDPTGNVGTIAGSVIYGGGVDDVATRILNGFLRTVSVWNRAL